MTKRAPVTIPSEAMAGHPAWRAWMMLPAARGRPVAIEVWRDKSDFPPASIFRLVLAGDAPASVFAKRCDRDSAAVERLIYEAILPSVPVTSPAYLGACDDADGWHWLFLEDVGGVRLDPDDAEHRRLAGRWIGRLHAHGSRVAAAAAHLPSAGPDRYRDRIDTTRERIRTHMGNPGLTASDREVLQGVLALQDRVGALWPAIERACDAAPTTLIHGDFRPKNLRVLPGPDGPVLYALDWETAGWGFPGVDLARARGPGAPKAVDPEAYASEVRSTWPDLDAVAVGRLSRLGHVLGALVAMEWESLSLKFESPSHLVGPVASMRNLALAASQQLDDAEEWLT